MCRSFYTWARSARTGRFDPMHRTAAPAPRQADMDQAASIGGRYPDRGDHGKRRRRFSAAEAEEPCRRPRRRPDRAPGGAPEPPPGFHAAADRGAAGRGARAANSWRRSSIAAAKCPAVLAANAGGRAGHGGAGSRPSSSEIARITSSQLHLTSLPHLPQVRAAPRRSSDGRPPATSAAPRRSARSRARSSRASRGRRAGAPAAPRGRRSTGAAVSRVSTSSGGPPGRDERLGVDRLRAPAGPDQSIASLWAMR